MKRYVVLGLPLLVWVTMLACVSHERADDRSATGVYAAPSGPADTSTPTVYLPVVTNAFVSGLVMPADLLYLGAFRLPDDGPRPRTFEYGGNAMTFNPDGPPATDNTLPGSLFITGHDRMPFGELPDGDQVAEVNIPQPVNSRNLDDLPYAVFVQGFTNVAAEYFHDLKCPRWACNI